jgi:hypothetical protein
MMGKEIIELLMIDEMWGYNHQNYSLGGFDNWSMKNVDAILHCVLMLSLT